MIKLSWKSKQLTKKTQLTPTTTGKTLILTKRVRNFIYALLGVISIALIFSFEFFENWSEEVVIARAEHKAKKKISNSNLNWVKEQAKGTEIGKLYFKSKKETDKAWELLKLAKEETKVLGFRSWQQFFGEFGPWCAFFLFASFHLLRSYIREPKNKGLILFNLAFVTATIFFLIWIFQHNQDFPKLAYYCITLLCGSIVYLGVRLLIKNYNGRLNLWRKKFYEMARFSFLHTKEESKQEMLNKIEDLYLDK
jgi:hypothetical protein